MKKRYLALTVAAITILLNLVIPACGSKGNNANINPYGQFACQPGQQNCTVNGTPMFPAYIYTSLDYAGSAAQIQLYAVAGGGVTVQAMVYLAPGNPMNCPPGMIPVQGPGSWQPNYGGTLGLVQAQMTGQNFNVTMNGEVYQGQDPNVGFATQFYYMGSFGNSCDPGAEGL